MAQSILETHAFEAAEKIRRQEFLAEEYVAATLERISKVEPHIHAYITTIEEPALIRAREIDRKIRKGEAVGRLAGLPMAVKDNICIKGIRTTCASLMLKDFIAPYDATVIERILQEDGVIIGKTNLDEFAMGTSTEHSHFGPTKNPWDTSKVPGGSSGGSAASVAAFETAFALGSDTGGSVRSPASFCSVVGLKPTYGGVSRYGLISYANSLEQVGPLARDVRSCALLMDVIDGHDARDSTSSDGVPAALFDTLTQPKPALTIGVPTEFFGNGTQDAVSKMVWRAIHSLEDAGFRYEMVSLPRLKCSLPVYYIIAMSEASSNLARYDGIRYGYRVADRTFDWTVVFSKDRGQGFGPEVRRRIMLGTYALSAGYFDQYYLKAQKIRTLIKEELDAIFTKFDLLVAPSMPILPFRLGEKIDDPLELYMCDVATVPANLAGIPSISVPCGVSEGLPVGLQLMGPPFCEDVLFRTARLIEERMPVDREIGEFTHV
jgi:aspartyl-tRNA(Asn)/glutamyl-tRNA(Gln) amidotransferase subunit A